MMSSSDKPLVPPIRQILNHRGVVFCLSAYAAAGLDVLTFPESASVGSWDPMTWRAWLRAVTDGEFSAWVPTNVSARRYADRIPDRIQRMIDTQRRLVADYPNLWPGDESVKERLNQLWAAFEVPGALPISTLLTNAEVNEIATILQLPSAVHYGEVRSIYWAPFPVRKSLGLSSRALVLTVPPSASANGDRWVADTIAAELRRASEGDDEPPSLVVRRE
jgi:hypothetical protein